MTRREFTKLLILRTAGNFLILFTIFGFFATFGPAAYYEVSYRVEKARGVTYVVADEKPSELAAILEKYKNRTPQDQGPNVLGDILSKTTEKILVPPDINFSVIIPKIGAAERIQENVDPSNESEYLDVLRHSIAHAKGTSFPGMGSTTYLFAHSADNFWNVGRYNAVFYLLKELNNGDDVYVFFQGKRYNYKVYDKQIVDPSQTSVIAANQGEGEKVILQTCWPPGTSWKRLLVFASPKG